MPDLQWDENELVEYFSVLPTTDEDAVHHSFELTRDNLRMLFTIWKYESVMRLTLSYCDSQEELLDVTAFVRGGITVRRHIGTNAPYLGLSDCILAPTRFSYNEMPNSPFNKEKFPWGVNMHIWVDPRICCYLTEQHEL